MKKILILNSNYYKDISKNLVLNAKKKLEESKNVNPKNPYAMSKLLCELMIENSMFQYNILRVFKVLSVYLLKKWKRYQKN